MSEAPGHLVIRTGLRDFLDLDRYDILFTVGIVVFAFLLRFLSPIVPTGAFTETPARAVQVGPVTAWGLGFPFNPDECIDDAPVGPHDIPTHTCGFVFDEIYFATDAAKDLHQPPISYFDPEPPLTKLLMAPAISIGGFTTWMWRITTTIAGSLFVGLIYLIGRRLRRDRFFASAAAIFVCLDGLAFVESRTGVIDMIAVFFVALVLYTFLLHWQARTARQWRATLYALATVAGLALGAKFTALAPLALVATFTGVRWLWGRRSEAQLWKEAGSPVAWAHYGGAILLTLFVFVACFSRYLSIPHDDVYQFTSCDPKVPGVAATTNHLVPPRSLQVGPIALPNPVDAVGNVIAITGAGLQYHEQECHTHPYASRWYTWPVMYHPVLFYYSGQFTTAGGDTAISAITNMGNPALWWLGIPALLFCVWRSMCGRWWWRWGLLAGGVFSLLAAILIFHGAEQPDAVTVRVTPSLWFLVAVGGVGLFALGVVYNAVVSRRFVPGFIVFGYIVAWFMWVFGNERRILFFYHALGMLIFTALALAYSLAAIRRTSVSFGKRRIPLTPLAYAGVAVVVAAFVFFYPVWTGLPLTQPDHAMRTWVDVW